MTDYVKDMEEVDTALFQKLSGFVLDGVAVPVTFYDPDVELSQRKDDNTEDYFPAIVLFRQSEIADFDRYGGVDPIRDNEQYDGSGNLVSVDVRYPPEPWNVFYSVRVITRFQQDLVKLKQFYRKTFPLRFSYLEISGNKYDVSQVGTSVQGGQYKEFGEMKNGEREFSDVFLLKVEINLEVYDRETRPVATEIGTQIDIIP